MQQQRAQQQPQGGRKSRGGMLNDLSFVSLCRNCGRPESEVEGGKLTGCGRCKVAKYCHKDCQKEHWKLGGHKLECAPLKPPVFQTRSANKAVSAIKRIHTVVE